MALSGSIGGTGWTAMHGLARLAGSGGIGAGAGVLEQAQHVRPHSTICRYRNVMIGLPDESAALGTQRFQRAALDLEGPGLPLERPLRHSMAFRQPRCGPCLGPVGDQVAHEPTAAERSDRGDAGR